MSEALILIVNDKDQPIGEANDEEVLKLGLIHRVARVMIEDGEENILLQKRADGMRFYPKCWDTSAGGRVDAGETNKFAASRELFEEIGIKARNLDYLGCYFTDHTYEKQNIKRFNHTYKKVVHKNIITKLNPLEVSQVKWFSISEIKKMIKVRSNEVTDGLTDIIKRYY